MSENSLKERNEIPTNRKNNILYLIGGSGFVGKNIIKKLYKNYEISVFDQYIDDIFFKDFKNVTPFKIDLANDIIPYSLPDPDFIINLASVVTAERDLNLFDSLINSNLKILLNLYERFKNSDALKLFIQFGSSEEYGNEGSPFKETMREKPVSPYALIKQLTTNTALMLNTNYGFPTCVVRPGNLYGEGQPKNKFIPYIIEKLQNNETLEVTPCEQKRDFIEIKAFVDILGKLLVNYKKCIGEIINVSSGKSVTLKSLIEFYKSEFSSASDIKYGALPYREGEAMDLCCDITKLQSIINTFDKNLLEKTCLK